MLEQHNRAGYKQPETLKGAQMPEFQPALSFPGVPTESGAHGAQEHPGWFLSLPCTSEALWQSGCDAAETDTRLLRPRHTDKTQTLSATKPAGMDPAGMGPTRWDGGCWAHWILSPWAAFEFSEIGRFCSTEELCAWLDNFPHKHKTKDK